MTLVTRYINGKFTAQPTTGVQRVAAQLVQALDARSEPLPGRWVLLCPPGATLPLLQQIECRVVGRPGWPLHAWEQVMLPLAARGGRLLSLAGSAPWCLRSQDNIVHDAAVFDQAQAYTLAFVAWYRALFRRLARGPGVLVTVSADARQRLARALGVPATRIGVLFNGADHLDGVVPAQAVLQRWGLQGQDFLLAVGSANPTKNLDRLVQAYSALQRRGLPGLRKLVIVGGSRPRVFAARSSTADPPGVVRTGPLDDASLKALYQQARALVFPSTYEGFGLPPVEAMACGCPVLAARATSIPEVCGDAALYFDPCSLESIGDAIAQLLSDEALGPRLRAAGYRRAASYRWQDAAEQLLALLGARARGAAA